MDRVTKLLCVLGCFGESKWAILKTAAGIRINREYSRQTEVYSYSVHESGLGKASLVVKEHNPYDRQTRFCPTYLCDFDQVLLSFWLFLHMEKSYGCTFSTIFSFGKSCSGSICVLCNWILSSVRAFLSCLVKYYIWLSTVHYFGQSLCSAAETRTHAEIVRGCYKLILPVDTKVLTFSPLPPPAAKTWERRQSLEMHTRPYFCVSLPFIPLPVLPREMSPKVPKLAMAIVVKKVSLYC